MKITSGVLKRVAVPALVAGMALPLALATSSAAQQPGPASTVTRSGGTVAYSAYSGEDNKLRVRAEADVNGNLVLVVEDLEGIDAGFGCQQDGPNVAVCDLAGTVTRISAQLRDGTDTAFIEVSTASTVNAGTGADIVETSGGNDTIDLRDGVGGNDSASCGGGGSDTAIGNPGDRIAANCERRAF
ncbi:hypothetical protein J7E96_16645 [Streptomyces sp. ISL-96]|uniref:hypothetical protein n=1 Tax=Streptomyces sp. ISL-96 TaxID=2819191 RepID=UPI001BE77A00|nr:hypothetical protein [Streptomyces sp. ISL-96]MBT2490119.1 hypothetical protein [Streptomyces sp. ISL-96]